MFYRITNKKRGPVQIALRTRDGNGTQVIVLPWKGQFDVSEERYNEQITTLERRGVIVVEKIYKK